MANLDRYTAPPEGQWVLVKIVSVTEEILNRRVVMNDEICDKEIPHIRLEMVHVSSAYGVRQHPYHLTLVAINDVFLAFRSPRGDSKIWKVRHAEALRRATGLTDGQDLSSENLLGKNVRGLVRYIGKHHIVGSDSRSSREKAWDQLHNLLLPEDGMTIPLVLRDGSVTYPQVTWDTVHRILDDPKSGTKVDVLSIDLGKQITAVLVGDEWRDIHEV